jgi:phosphatidate cytidylyltransferase
MSAPIINNPILNPDFWPSVRALQTLFIFGAGLVFFFARKNLLAGLRGELGRRYLTWLFLTPLYVLAAFAGGWLGALVWLGATSIAAREAVAVFGITRPYARLLFALIPLTLYIAIAQPQIFAVLPVLGMLLPGVLAILASRNSSVAEAQAQAAQTSRAYLYVVWSLSHIILLQRLGGPGLTLLLGVAIALSDVMQYCVGKLIGRHVIAPSVSPNKAWEGMVGDLLGAGLAIGLFGFLAPAEFRLWHKIGLTIIVGLSASWGDLFRSLLKRASGAKDWGALLPGHGGLLDRANSFVVAIPLAYYYCCMVLGQGVAASH